MKQEKGSRERSVKKIERETKREGESRVYLTVWSVFAIGNEIISFASVNLLSNLIVYLWSGSWVLHPACSSLSLSSPSSLCQFLSSLFHSLIRSPLLPTLPTGILDTKACTKNLSHICAICKTDASNHSIKSYRNTKRLMMIVSTFGPQLNYKLDR